jgi:hypothetical protein
MRERQEHLAAQGASFRIIFESCRASRTGLPRRLNDVGRGDLPGVVRRGGSGLQSTLAIGLDAGRHARGASIAIQVQKITVPIDAWLTTNTRTPHHP